MLVQKFNDNDYNLVGLTEEQVMWVYDGLKAQRAKLTIDLDVAMKREDQERESGKPTGQQYRASEDLAFLGSAIGQVAEIMQAIEASDLPN